MLVRTILPNGHIQDYQFPNMPLHIDIEYAEPNWDLHPAKHVTTKVVLHKVRLVHDSELSLESGIPVFL